MGEPRITGFSRRFVGLVFIVLALSFWASTASVVHEFAGDDLEFILASSSNIFLYFPTLGIVALAAFYVPAVIFTDLYWTNKVSWGRVRYLVGLGVVCLLAYGASWYLGSQQRRPVWEISPKKLELDQGAQARCKAAPSARCPVALRDVAHDLRGKALGRLRLSPLVRLCTIDPLVEPSPDMAAQRYCFATGTMTDAKSCCDAQRALMESTRVAWLN
ncbi:MAG: hypothetical protein JSS20_14710, partial [Proteobacteria bacterium]|nr:hypothetical protein [Pseudomonadota bacterium]